MVFCVLFRAVCAAALFIRKTAGRGRDLVAKGLKTCSPAVAVQQAALYAVLFPHATDSFPQTTRKEASLVG